MTEFSPEPQPDPELGYTGAPVSVNNPRLKALPEELRAAAADGALTTEEIAAWRADHGLLPWTEGKGDEEPEEPEEPEPTETSVDWSSFFWISKETGEDLGEQPEDWDITVTPGEDSATFEATDADEEGMSATGSIAFNLTVGEELETLDLETTFAGDAETVSIQIDVVDVSGEVPAFLATYSSEPETDAPATLSLEGAEPLQPGEYLLVVGKIRGLAAEDVTAAVTVTLSY